MQVHHEQSGTSQLTIEVKLNKADVENEVNKSLRDYQRKAVIPGFRPGKVPFGMVKKMYGPSMMAEQMNKKISTALNDYITENDLKILGYPIADAERTGNIDFDNNDEFSFFFDAGISPELDINLSEISMVFPKVRVTEDEIETTIEKMRVDYPSITYPEVVETSDELELNITEADENGNEKDDGFSDTLVLNLKEFAGTGIEEAFVGKTDGSEFVVNFAKYLDANKTKKLLKLDDEPDADTISTSDFNVVISMITRHEKSELDEEFFGRVFQNETVTTVEEFKTRIGDEIQKHMDEQSKYLVYSLALKKIIDETPMELPHDFMKRWIIDNSEGAVTTDEIEKNYDDYEKSLRFQLIEEHLNQKYPELNVDKTEVRMFVLNYFFGNMLGSFDQLDDEMKDKMMQTVEGILKNKKEEQRIVSQLREKKLVELFSKQLKLEEKEMTQEEFKEFTKQNQADENTENDE